MARQLKRWESPRREGRNDKGRGGAARKRQRQKQIKNLMKKLKQQDDRTGKNHNSDNNFDSSFDNPYRTQEGREPRFSSLFFNGTTNSPTSQTWPQKNALYLRAQLYMVLRSTTSVKRSIAVVNLS